MSKTSKTVSAQNEEVANNQVESQKTLPYPTTEIPYYEIYQEKGFADSNGKISISEIDMSFFLNLLIAERNVVINGKTKGILLPSSFQEFLKSTVIREKFGKQNINFKNFKLVKAIYEWKISGKTDPAMSHLWSVIHEIAKLAGILLYSPVTQEDGKKVHLCVEMHNIKSNKPNQETHHQGKLNVFIESKLNDEGILVNTYKSVYFTTPMRSNHARFVEPYTMELPSVETNNEKQKKVQVLVTDENVGKTVKALYNFISLVSQLERSFTYSGKNSPFPLNKLLCFDKNAKKPPLLEVEMISTFKQKILPKSEIIKSDVELDF